MNTMGHMKERYAFPGFGSVSNADTFRRNWLRNVWRKATGAAGGIPFASSAVRLGSVNGIEIRMHIAFPLLVLSCFMLGQWTVMRTLLIVLIVHEAAHTVMAAALGLRVVSLELTPFGGVARVEGLGHALAWQEMLVALAGPASNLLMAMAASFGVTMGLWPGYAIQLFVRCNLALMLSNLLPALPLDGGRAVRALSSGALGWRRATRVFSWCGVALGAALIGIGIYEAVNRRVNPTFFLSGSYLVYCALNERNEASNWIVKGLSSRASQFAESAVVPAKWLAVSADTQVSVLPQKISSKGYTIIIVVDPVGMKEMGILHEHDLLDVMMSDQRMTVGDVIRQREPVAVDVTAKAREAVWRTAREGKGLHLSAQTPAQ